MAYGEPEYRNALCAQIGEKVVQASLEEGDALTIEFENGTVFGLSLREEDVGWAGVRELFGDRRVWPTQQEF